MEAKKTKQDYSLYTEAIVGRCQFTGRKILVIKILVITLSDVLLKMRGMLRNTVNRRNDSVDELRCSQDVD